MSLLNVGAIEAAIDNGRIMIMIVSLCLGATAYSVLNSLSFDIFIVKSLLKEEKWYKETFKILTRATYFLTKILALLYFTNSLLIPTKNVSCEAVTRFEQVLFFILQVTNHWLFASRNLATWSSSRFFPYVFAYAVSGITILAGLAIVNIWDGKVGTVLPITGCTFPLNDQTRPRLAFSIPILVVGISYHTINMSLTCLRFASSLALIQSTKTQPRGMSISFATTTIRSNRSEPQDEGSPNERLARQLIRHGLHYWILCLISSFVFMVIPLMLHLDNWKYGGAVALYTAIDTELAGHIFRDTVSLAHLARTYQTPTSTADRGSEGTSASPLDIETFTKTNNKTLNTVENAHFIPISLRKTVHHNTHQVPTALLGVSDDTLYHNNKTSFLPMDPSPRNEPISLQQTNEWRMDYSPPSPVLPAAYRR